MPVHDVIQPMALSKTAMKDRTPSQARRLRLGP